MDKMIWYGFERMKMHIRVYVCTYMNTYNLTLNHELKPYDGGRGDEE